MWVLFLLCRGQRVIYTTPLKALSNQKLYEMRKQFGHDIVGLQTGDISLNAEGDIVVMTTEILRNILFRETADAGSGKYLLSKAGSVLSVPPTLPPIVDLKISKEDTQVLRPGTYLSRVSLKLIFTSLRHGSVSLLGDQILTLIPVVYSPFCWSTKRIQDQICISVCVLLLIWHLIAHDRQQPDRRSQTVLRWQQSLQTIHSEVHSNITWEESPGLFFSFVSRLWPHAEGASPKANQMADVGLVVLDEVHYLGDVDRGSVWEEVIISCPQDIPLICMSATVQNPNDLGGWITKVGSFFSSDTLVPRSI